MTSIVIAAHNEETVIGRCLDTLLADAHPGEFDVTVVANGCSDRTAEVAGARAGVRVLEVARPGKSNALNVGDIAADGFPRIYLDADINADTAVARALVGALGDAPDPPAAVVPRRELDLDGRPFLVRQYFAIHSRLPVYRDGLFGRGMIAVSERGRKRFEQFPDLVADDLFLDSQFATSEKRQVDTVATVVAAPLRTRDLVRRLVRVRRGNAAMRSAGRTGQVDSDIRAADRMAWFREVVVPNPRLAPAGVVYVGITVLSALLARRSSPQSGWERDESTRTPRSDHN